MSTLTTDDELDFDWAAPNALGPGFYPRMRKIQQRDEPMFWSAKQNAWLITRYADVTDALAERRFSNHRMHLLLDPFRRGDVFEQYPRFSHSVLKWVFNIDPPEHSRLRKLIVKPFSRTQADRYRDSAAESLRTLLAAAADKGEVDFISEMSLPYSCGNLIKLMGLDGVVTIEQMMGWATAVVVAFGTSYANPKAAEGAEKAIVEITEIVGSAIEDRRRNPREDLLTQLVQLSEDGDKLTTDEIIYLFHVVLLGGFDTTGHTLAHIVNTLHEQPQQVDYIRANPDKNQIVVDELQRHIGLIGAMSRVVAEDMEWGGQQARAGDLVYLMFAAANRDPEVFAEPDEIRFDRPRTNSMVFGPGLHHCVGHYFARMQLEVGVDVLFSGEHRVEVLDEPLVWTPNPLTRSLLRLPVRVTLGDGAA